MQRFRSVRNGLALFLPQWPKSTNAVVSNQRQAAFRVLFSGT
jgi:hypothetical protein